MASRQCMGGFRWTAKKIIRTFFTVLRMCIAHIKSIFFAAITSIILLSMSTTDDNAYPEWRFLMEDRRPEPTMRGYAVDTVGCKIPDFDPLDRTVSDYYQSPPPYNCTTIPSFIRHDGNILFLDPHILRVYYRTTTRDVRCSYRRIKRNASIENPDLIAIYSRKYVLHFGTPLRAEFIRVECKYSSTGVHNEFFMLPVLKPQAERRCSNVSQQHSFRMNIVVLGLDSVSRLNSLRHLGETRRYLSENFHPIELHGFNKVGDNSFPNQLAMLSGQTEAEGNDVCRKGYFDGERIIWKTYAELGYRTMFLEETPRFGLFSYLCNGFHYRPTDYYPRPFLLAVDYSGIKDTGSDTGNYCIGSKLQTAFYLEYTSSLLAFLGNSSYFTYTWISDVSHDDLNSAGYADAPFRQTLETMSRTGVLNRSLVVLLSDHGLRYGDVRLTLMGKYEDRLPFCWLLFPPSFQDKYPTVMDNLRINQHRLTTPYDIHATLLELSNFPQSINNPQFQTKRGLSLLHEIPEWRSCKDAFVSPHFCCCQKLEELSASHALSWKMAKFLVKTVNTWLANEAPGQCWDHRLVAVLDVRKISAGESRATTHFWVTVATMPGQVTMEGTVGKTGDGNFSVDNVSRLTIYRRQSHCVKTRMTVKLCVCKD